MNNNNYNNNNHINNDNHNDNHNNNNNDNDTIQDDFMYQIDLSIIYGDTSYITNAIKKYQHLINQSYITIAHNVLHQLLEESLEDMQI